jgi:hypothetical protein
MKVNVGHVGSVEFQAGPVIKLHGQPMVQSFLNLFHHFGQWPVKKCLVHSIFYWLSHFFSGSVKYQVGSFIWFILNPYTCKASAVSSWPTLNFTNFTILTHDHPEPTNKNA